MKKTTNIKLPTTEPLRDKINYGLYCVNIYGTALNAIRDEFKRQIRTGLRPTVYVLDLDDIRTTLDNQPPSNSNKSKELQESNTDLMNSIFEHIQEIFKDYGTQIKKLNEGSTFDLYGYWLKQTGDDKKTIVEKSDNTKGRTNGKKNNNITKSGKELQADKKEEVSCTSILIAKKHNRVGQPKTSHTSKFRRDEPILGKLYIIILGQVREERFYTDLLRWNQPLEGIINFIPTESNYDIMLGNNKLRNFITTTLEAINSSIYKLRQEMTMKPVALISHELPTISSCLATKHAQELFDQLTWSIYDIDILKQQYENYYFKPFQVMNVEISDNVNLRELYHDALGHLSVQMPLLSGSDADLTSVAGYLNSLLTSTELQEDFMEEKDEAETSANKFRNSFVTVTSNSRCKKLVVAENNKLLLNMLQCADLESVDSINLCCLDYNIFRQYVISPSISIDDKSVDLNTSYNLTLPQYVKYYADTDCCSQRLIELMNEYDNEYSIHEFSPGYKLYTFKRTYNVLNVKEGRSIIPTRLCFRDFTLFLKEDFLKNLKTADLEETNSTGVSATSTKTGVEFDENIFIRPNSLKDLNARYEGKSKEYETKKREPDSPIIGSEKRASVSKPIPKTSEGLGLPPESSLLKGYNLEDTLQEVKYKTSKYYYRHGYVKLYEEQWCFEDTNKQLSLSINDTTLFFSSLRHQLKGISNSVRLITRNNISIRILNQPEESLKIIMNYPNGLSVLHHESYCEQVWHCEKTPRNEQKRIFTNCGAIIIFPVQSNGVIMIIRYNGEVYKLYQDELADEVVGESDGEEDEGEGESEREGYEGGPRIFGDIEEKSSSDALNAKELPQNYDSKKQRIPTTTVLKSRQSENVSNEELFQISAPYNLKSLVNYELKFLRSLCATYGLTYLHLIITTSRGNRIKLTHKVDIFETRPCLISEWHDYAANEAYCERSDGVKMIWNQNTFKCFHADGTVFTTTLREDVTESTDDEIETEISQSSSHNESLEEVENGTSRQKLEEYFRPNPAAGKLIFTFSPSVYATTESAEEYIPNDIHTTRCTCQSWFMQHPNYAEVYVQRSKLHSLPAQMEVLGMDNVKICTQLDEDVEGHDSVRSADSEGITEDKIDTAARLLINVSISENLFVTTDEKGCEIYAIVLQPQFNDRRSDSTTLNVKFTDCISDAFKNLVDKIAFLNFYSGQELEELHFVKKINTDSSIRGFEFFTTLPLTGQCTHRLSNSIIELKAVNTINEMKMINTRDGHKKELEKFPRFKRRQQEKSCYNPGDEFPRLVSANIIIEIPKQLQNLKNVTKFLEPFDGIHFHSLRGKFKNILDFHFRPQEQLNLKILTSKNNWKQRQWEHEKRIFNERQRLGLYSAMKKHKIYPNYWTFRQKYGNDLRNLDFFDFMQKHCENKSQSNEVN